MRFSVTSIAVLAFSVFGASVVAQTTPASDDLYRFGICTCFQPKYDASCCILAQGFQMNDGNVCRTIDYEDSVNKYRDCCTKAGGRVKCKPGYRDPSHWPPEDSYGCKV